MANTFVRNLLLLLSIYAVVLGTQPIVFPQSGPVDRAKQVLAIDEARRQAMLHGDVEALNLLIADDATVIWGDGTTDNKQSMLELLRSGRLHYARSEYENSRVRLYGDTAILTGDARIQATSEHHAVAYLVRVTRVYVFQKRRWRLVAVQTTRVSALKK